MSAHINYCRSIYTALPPRASLHPDGPTRMLPSWLDNPSLGLYGRFVDARSTAVSRDLPPPPPQPPGWLSPITSSTINAILVCGRSRARCPYLNRNRRSKLIAPIRMEARDACRYPPSVGTMGACWPRPWEDRAVKWGLPRSGGCLVVIGLGLWWKQPSSCWWHDVETD